MCLSIYPAVTVFNNNNYYLSLTPQLVTRISAGRTRPADILVTSWGVKDTAAFDITVTSPLSPKIVSEAGVSAGVAAKAAESRKHEQNDTKCSELGWQCIPLAVETYGAWSEEACNAFSCIAMHKAILTNCSKSQVLGDLYGRLSIVLVRANARAILATSLQVADMQVDQWTTDLSV